MSKLNLPSPSPARGGADRRRRSGGGSPAEDSTPVRLASLADLPLAGGGDSETGFRNASRFSEARLHAVSSKNMYSEHGFDARIGPEAGQVCQSFTVVWNCRPGSALAQAACPIFSHSARAFRVLATLPGLVRQVRSQSPSASTALRNSSVTRTELLEVWPGTVR